jgi:dienelactone hydrolase
MHSSRREFLMTAAALPSAGRAASPPSRGAAQGSEIEAAGRALDSLDYALARAKAAEPSMAFAARTRADALAWQRRLRRRVTELLGGFPADRTPLAARVLRTDNLDGYRRERVLFRSRPDLEVFGYFLTPEDFRKPGPAMICLPGHGRGVDEIIGIDRDGQQRKRYGEYQNDFALQCVANGIAAFAIEQLAFGYRRDAAARKGAASRSSCQPAAGSALMLGETMAGWRAWDVMRAIDYLETRPEIDPKRIGCMGISGGGTVTLYAAALEPRIKVAWMSGSFCTYRDSIYSLSHCIDNYVPGILKVAEAADVAGLIAPRMLFVENGEEDPIFPVAGTREAYASVSRVYKVFGAEANLGLEVFPAKHEFWGKKGFEFLKQNL